MSTPNVTDVLPDVVWYREMGQFLVDYGAWGAFLIMLTLYVWQQIQFARWRTGVAKTFEKYHDEIVDLNNKYAKSNKTEAGAIKDAGTAVNILYREFKANRTAIEKFLDFVLQKPGYIKIKTPDNEETKILKDFINGG